MTRTFPIYDTFRTRTGYGRGGWTYIGFNTALDGQVTSLVADDPTVVFMRVGRPARRN